MMSLFRVMYAPLDYIHPQHFMKPAEDFPPSLQQALNHHLIQRYQLITTFDFTVSPGDFSQRLITDWRLLPEVAWLLGCKLARGSLAKTGRLATLPDVAQRFVALPLPCPAYPSDFPVSTSDIEQIGARYLYQLQPHLPEALAQRLPLLFAPETKIADNANLATQAAPPALSLNRSLLTFAFDYAKNSSH